MKRFVLILAAATALLAAGTPAATPEVPVLTAEQKLKVMQAAYRMKSVELEAERLKAAHAEAKAAYSKELEPVSGHFATHDLDPDLNLVPKPKPQAPAPAAKK